MLPTTLSVLVGSSGRLLHSQQLIRVVRKMEVGALVANVSKLWEREGGREGGREGRREGNKSELMPLVISTLLTSLHSTRLSDIPVHHDDHTRELHGVEGHGGLEPLRAGHDASVQTRPPLTTQGQRVPTQQSNVVSALQLCSCITEYMMLRGMYI